jgi:TRAP-type C4-dicarboxylate transport system substrate-binding protein
MKKDKTQQVEAQQKSTETTRRKFLKTTVAAGIGAAAAAPTLFNIGSARAANKTYNWKFVCDWPATDLQMSQAVPRFAKWVEHASNGRLKITVYSGGQLVPPSESFDNLRRGTIQLLQSIGPYHAGKIPLAMVAFQLPMGPRGIKDYQKIFWDYGMFDLVDQTYRKLGIRYLDLTPYGGANLTSKKPLRTIDDFKGLKMRTVGPQATMWKELGAATVFISGSELYLALQTGVVDAYTWSNMSVDNMKFHEVTKYMIMAYPVPEGNSTGSGNGCFLMNAKAFEELPADLQNIVVRCGQQYGRYSSMIYNDWDEWFQSGGAAKLGMEIIELSKEDTDQLRQIAIEKVWPKFAKDEASTQYIETVKQFLKDEKVL